MMFKKCHECGVNKLLIDFYKNNHKQDGYDYICKQCTKDRHKKYYNNVDKNELKKKRHSTYILNKALILEKKKSYYINNKLNILNSRKEYYSANKYKILEYRKTYSASHRELLKLRNHIRYINNSAIIISKNVRYEMNKRKKDPYYKMCKNIRSRFKNALKKYSKNGKIMSCLEYGINFKEIFNKIGVPPNNSYHLDHIIPLKLFNLDDPVQVKLAFSYINLQWLSAEENMKKSDKLLDYVFENSELVNILLKIGYFNKGK